MQLPGFVDSHADEKNYELAIHLGRHTGTNNLCHKASSWPDLPIRDPGLFPNSIRLRSLTQIRCTRRVYAAGGAMELNPSSWVKATLDEWVQAGKLTAGGLFRRVNKNGKAWGDGLTEKAVWHVVREYARKAGIERLAPHDLRRTCARLYHAAGGELEQIQFLLEHDSIQTTERRHCSLPKCC
jgi:hypothetical protein